MRNTLFENHHSSTPLAVQLLIETLNRSWTASEGGDRDIQTLPILSPALIFGITGNYLALSREFCTKA